MAGGEGDIQSSSPFFFLNSQTLNLSTYFLNLSLTPLLEPKTLSLPLFASRQVCICVPICCRTITRSLAYPQCRSTLVIRTDDTSRARDYHLSETAISRLSLPNSSVLHLSGSLPSCDKQLTLWFLSLHSFQVRLILRPLTGLWLTLSLAFRTNSVTKNFTQ